MRSFSLPRHPAALLPCHIGPIAQGPAFVAGEGRSDLAGFAGESLAKKTTNPKPHPRR